MDSLFPWPIGRQVLDLQELVLQDFHPSQAVAVGNVARRDKGAPLDSRAVFNKRQTIFRAGDPAVRMYQVVEGAVMIYQLLDDGRRQVVELVLAGGLCGFSSTGLHASTCEALRRTVVSSFTKSELRHLPELRNKMDAAAERQICALHEHAVSLGRKTAEERVCSLLMRLAGESQGRLPSDLPARAAPSRAASPQATCRTLDVPMTRGEIGDYLGLSLETVCRILSDLQHRGIIEIGRKQGEVHVRSLRRLCGAARHKAA